MKERSIFLQRFRQASRATYPAPLELCSNKFLAHYPDIPEGQDIIILPIFAMTFAHFSRRNWVGRSEGACECLIRSKERPRISSRHKRSKATKSPSPQRIN